MKKPVHPPPSSRHQVLLDGLPVTAKLLHQRQASDIPEGYVEDYLALDWLEWHGGTLRLTITGQNICRYAASRHAGDARG
ncbi:hypothetical protein [Azohydromonas caseinilytica]|uniref:Uncharacterized protein n=1 Tax=Azohydromonas caseinilytica TaxID=2728836 RepID=A0A848FB10_9BURK|nr:hypothetical protein [Azohydromonas caseinilytica]NML16478.1 hypothetical protein [Azohydromonas caseinilytica]